ncbi:MAG: hypothetical protein ACJ72H_15325 [Candidatus Sulfotelmatobacter sp.]
MPRVRRRSWLGGSALVLFTLCLTGMLGCGGSGSASGCTSSAAATPPGSYSIQVTSSVGTAIDAQPVAVSLTVTE